MENLIGQSEAKEELEQKLMFLDNQLKARDDEIKNVILYDIIYLNFMINVIKAQKRKAEHGNTIERIKKRSPKL